MPLSVCRIPDHALKPSNAEATFFQGTRMHNSLKTLSCWYLSEKLLLSINKRVTMGLDFILFFQFFFALFCINQISHQQAKIKFISHLYFLSVLGF